LYSLLFIFFYKRYGTTPFGELRHGARGVYQSYSKIFKTDSLDLIIQYLMYLKKPYKGHHNCFCGGNKRLRDCHWETVKYNFKFPTKKLDDDIELLIDLKRKKLT
jgi:hypothetical protein